ncbi:methenyltetrahydrofolate synthase domain-containing protein [Tribolium castaneum]|uniref:Methenyltetrahydrofolate synthase domain-containing protein-like Protein n=2 Tax=Tribolium castaneum TaxID=7070 RepID=D6X243_TRICA|nr:PREDICTED: methenyltetrahydrofolate synthase domain-containing protein [Tribolium castaneum]EFA10212.1 Methenyltetrahydrofolate synthase domain-containing protein-like Protein [Tribolium castaneum]|eukprot:XP_966481.1 PREDICTED: methenyltetrahydrofolate synthase domain-containing protein [Tribolium castaneum]
MSAEGSVCEGEKPQPGPEACVEDNSKQSFRKKVWDYLEKNKLVNFPRPAFGRIPNFKGADKAAAQLLQLEEFKNAKSVEVNPDKPLEAARSLVIESDKTLYVPVPRLQEGLLKKIAFCEADKPKNVKQTVTRWGIETLGKAVDFGDGLHIDLLVLGSVAVSRDGRRIGKGRGYADLEYAILKEMKAVDDNTTIVTTVHDSQVFDCLPSDIFKKYDVPLDYILTPTQIIKVEKKLTRPEGIYWDILSQRRLSLMPVLQKIKEIHQSEGRDTTLKEEDTDVESEDKPRKYPKPRPKSNLAEQNELTDSGEKPRKRRFFRRTRSARITNENEDPGNKENNVTPPMKKKPRPFRRNPRRLQVDFSLVVSNIDKNVRVRHLKDALIDHGIKPNNITWRGYKGFCYLHYAKQVKKEADKIVEEKPFAVDNVIEILQTLKLNPESSNNLSVKVMEPITRIETTDVTAV